MKIYTVGGAVRDTLLGLAVKDRDHVVVGATPQQMLARGFTPVGKDFPVFLHPDTHEEYALARTERKTAPGYKGFVFHADAEVSLEQDLARRDLTINAIAQAEDGTLVDPFGGQRDLQARVFRHVSDAFAEDPVRILRVARFAARFTDFVLVPDTAALMRRMVEAGEVDALVPERVWQELSRGLMEARPSRMVTLLHECGALARLLPELDALWRNAQPAGATSAAQQALAMLDDAAAQDQPLPIRFAVLLHTVGNAEEPAAALDALCRRLKAPNDCRDLAVMTARHYRQIDAGSLPTPEEVVCLLERCDAFRKPQRFADMLAAIACIASISSTGSMLPAHLAYWRQALARAQAVDSGRIAAGVMQSSDNGAAQATAIPLAIHAARVEAVSSLPRPGVVS